MATNQHGLGRHIPNDVALQVRRQSKFGCVICRCAIYQYEHIDPPFAEATVHDPAKMCLLCGTCHDQVTRGRLSKATVLRAYTEVRTSNDIKRPFESLDLFSHQVSVGVGTTTFEQPQTVFRVDGEDLIVIRPAKDGAAFPTLSGVFYDNTGLELLRIEENIWHGQNNAFDIQVVGQSIIVKADKNRTALHLRLDPPHRVSIVEIDMYKGRSHLFIRNGEMLVGHLNEDQYSYIGLGNFHCIGASVGINVRTDGTTGIRPTGIRMVGGEGVILDGTGITIGQGAAQMRIQTLKVWAE